MTLRVLHVIGGNDTGGAMGNVLPLVSALRDEGCDAQLCCLGGGGLAKAAATERLPFMLLRMAFPWDVRVLPRLAGELSKGEWDVVHSHGMRANIPVRLLALLRARLSGRKPVLFSTVHSDLRLDYANPRVAAAYEALDRLTLPAVDRIVCVSGDLERRLVSRGYPRERLLVVHPGLPPGGHPSTAPARLLAQMEAAVRLGRQEAAAPLVGTVARLVPVKDLELFLRVIDRVSRTVRGAKGVIVGEGPERGRLQTLAKEWDLGAVVSFTGEIRPVRPALERFRVFLLTSFSEGIPIAALEAMDAGLPIVATDVGGLGEVVVPGVTGFLVSRHQSPSHVVAELAERVTTLLADEALRRRMGEAGRKRVQKEFSPSAAARRMLKAYHHSVVARDLRRRGD